MLLITLEKLANDCRVDLDGMDISRFVRALELTAEVGSLTEVRLTLLGTVTIVGEPGRLQFIKQGEEIDGQEQGPQT